MSTSPGSRTGPGPARRLPVGRHFTRRRAWSYLAVWILLALIVTPLAHQFSNRIQSTLSGMAGSAPETVKQNLVKNFSTALAFPTAIVWDAQGVPQDQADAAWAALIDKIKNDPKVQDVTDGKAMIANWPRPDWYAAFVADKDARTYGDAQKVIPKLRADVRTLTFPNGKYPWVTGGPALFLDLNLASTGALRTGELIALPVTFFILLLVFRSVIAALLPVIVATLGVVSTLGIMSFLASDHDLFGLHWNAMAVTFFVPNLVTMIGLGVGIDYCLIYLARYRRERALHLTTQEALQVARATAGRTVVASAVLVMSGFLTLLFIPLDFFTSIAVGGMLVVVVVMLATLTLLPAMIFLVGPKLEWGRISLAALHDLRVKANFGERWCQMLLKRPRLCLATGIVVLLILAVPVLDLRIGAPEARNLPVASDARQGYESLTHNLGSGWMMPAIVLVQHNSPDWITTGMPAEQQIVAQFNELPNTEKTLTVSDTTGSRREQQSSMGMLTSFTDPTQNVIMILSRADPQSPAARAWLVKIEQILSTAQIGDPGGSKYFLGGLPAVTFSADNVIWGTLPKVILVTLCSTFLLLLLFMRSLFVAVKAILLNLLCVLAAYGFQVLCFQEGWGSQLLGLYPTDGLNTVVLVICFCALFGLSMDYEVFILSAVRESWLDQHSMRLAVQDGFLRVGGIITSAAVIMVSVFLSFAFGDVVEIEQLGVGLSFAVLLDATLIRLFLVPCIMLLMGRWAFWLPGQPLPVAERHLHGQHQMIRRETSRITPRIPE